MVDQKLVDYVKSAIKSGRSKEGLKSDLLKRGWSEKDVDEVLSMDEGGTTGGGAAPAQPAKPAQGSGGAGVSHKTIYIVGAIIVALIVVLTVFYIVTILPNIGQTTGAVCGNGVCETGESYSNCPDDCTEPSPTGPIAVGVSPATKSVSNGEEFTIEVTITDVTDFFGYQFDVEYDPSILEFVRLEGGGFLNEGGTKNVFCVPLDTDTPGLVKNVACTRLGRGAVAGSGILNKVVFKAISTGTSPITLSNVLLANSNADKIDSTASNGEVTVS